MADTSKSSTRITYGRLDRALTTLGFVRKKTDEFTAYREAAHDALIVLPNMSPTSTVGDPHLVTVLRTVEGKGVVSADQFRSLLISLSANHSTNKTKTQVPRSYSLTLKPRKPLAKAQMTAATRVGHHKSKKTPAKVERGEHTSL